MAIPANTCRVALVGTVSDGEIFETGFWLAGEGLPDTLNDTQTLCDSIRDVFEDRMDAVVALLAPDSSYTLVKVYNYPAGGPTAEFVAQSTISGATGTGSTLMPLQQALVVTLRTSFSGRRSRGRMFLPANGRGLDTGHVFTTTITQGVTDAVGDFFDGVNAISDGDNRVSVVSTTGSVAHSVTQVTADQRPDIQRRRANSQPTGSVASTNLAA